MKSLKSSYTLEYSRYILPVDFPILGLLGPDWSLPDDEITFLHCHNCLEIGFCYGGSGILLVENKKFRFSEEDISVVCPNTMHKSKSDKGTESQWEYLYVDTERLFHEYLSVDFEKRSLLMFDSPDFPNIVSGRENPELKNLLLHILKELRDGREGYRLDTACLCISFLLELTRILPVDSGAGISNVKNKMAIYPAIQYIDRHYMENFRMEVLASECGLSLTHFRRLFKAIMNESPLDYLNRIRINKSCELLYDTERTVLDIAMAVGFSGNAAYNRNFMRIMETTPSRWRRTTRSFKKSHMEFSVFHMEHN